MLFRLTAATGMRRGEVLGLRWDDIHFDTGRIEITQALIAIGYQLEFTRLKTRTSRRNVALLAEWRRHQAAQLSASGAVNEHGLVFTRTDGKPLHPHTVSQAFERAQRRLDVSPIRFHDLRHTHATLLLGSGVHPKVVQERLGHSQIGVTLNTYSHVLPGLGREAVERLGAALGGGDEEGRAEPEGAERPAQADEDEPG